MTSELVKAALDLARAGLWVFPCKLDKRPLTEHGFKDAVNDLKKVRELFEFFGDAAKLIGVKTGKDSNLLALDFDLYKGNGVDKFMQELISKELLPETRIHSTKNGGVHVLYRASDFPNVNPHDGVEVRGDGSYIIWWPAYGCKVIAEGISEAPPTLIEYLRSYKRQQAHDTIDEIKEKILKSENFHDNLTRLAARLSSAGWSQEQVLTELLSCLKGSVASSDTHPRHGRWLALLANEANEIVRIVTTSHIKFNPQSPTSEGLDLDKFKTIANNLGFVSPLGRGVDKGERPYVKPVEAFEKTNEFPFESEGYFAHDDSVDLLSQRFVMYPLLCEDESVLIAAEPKTGKTALALTVGLHIACGLDLGQSLRVAEPRGVLYFGLEGRRAIRLRVTAWRRFLSESGQDVPAFIPLFVVERSKNLLHEHERQTLANAIKASSTWMEKQHDTQLGAIFIDTYTKAMPGGDQNSVEDTSSVFDVVTKIRELGVKATVVFIHHKARAGHIRGSTNIEADPDVLTSVIKTGDIIEWRLDRARSIEEGGSYYFKLHNFVLGNSGQGYSINAPVVEAVDAELVSNAGIEETRKDAAILTIIVSLGKGRHPLSNVHELVHAAGLAPVSSVRRVRQKLRINHQKIQSFYNDLIPNTGYVFAGHSVEKILEGGLIVAFFVR